MSDVAETIRDIRALAGRHDAPSAQTILLMAWREQVQADAETQFKDAEGVATAKHMARVQHGGCFDAPVLSHAHVPWVNRLHLPGTFIDRTEFRWPTDAVVDCIAAAIGAVPLWVHYWRAVNEMTEAAKEAKNGQTPALQIP